MMSTVKIATEYNYSRCNSDAIFSFIQWRSQVQAHLGTDPSNYIHNFKKNKRDFTKLELNILRAKPPNCTKVIKFCVTATNVQI